MQILAYMPYLMIKVVLTDNIVTFEQLGPGVRTYWEDLFFFLSFNG